MCASSVFGRTYFAPTASTPRWAGGGAAFLRMIRCSTVLSLILGPPTPSLDRPNAQGGGRWETEATHFKGQTQFGWNNLPFFLNPALGWELGSTADGGLELLSTREAPPRDRRRRIAGDKTRRPARELGGFFHDACVRARPYGTRQNPFGAREIMTLAKHDRPGAMGAQPCHEGITRIGVGKAPRCTRAREAAGSGGRPCFHGPSTWAACPVPAHHSATRPPCPEGQKPGAP